MCTPDYQPLVGKGARAPLLKHVDQTRESGTNQPYSVEGLIIIAFETPASTFCSMPRRNVLLSLSTQNRISMVSCAIELPRSVEICLPLWFSQPEYQLPPNVFPCWAPFLNCLITWNEWYHKRKRTFAVSSGIDISRQGLDLEPSSLPPHFLLSSAITNL